MAETTIEELREQRQRLLDHIAEQKADFQAALPEWQRLTNLKSSIRRDENSVRCIDDRIRELQGDGGLSTLQYTLQRMTQKVERRKLEVRRTKARLAKLRYFKNKDLKSIDWITRRIAELEQGDGNGSKDC